MTKREQFIKDGYIAEKNVLSKELIAELRSAHDSLFSRQTPEEQMRLMLSGASIAGQYDEDVFAKVISNVNTLKFLNDLGYNDPKWWSSFLLDRPAHSGPLYWHQDNWCVQADNANNKIPFQIFVMYYLVDTTPENGCLRVIPGTHHYKHPLLNIIHDTDDLDIKDQTFHSTRYYSDYVEGEVDVPVNVGDVIIGDARILHASHPNNTDNIRTVYTSWFYPDFENLPENVKARVARTQPLEPPFWWENKEIGKLVEPLIPYYSGTATPIEPQRNPLKV
jgi:hypothetical protein